MAEINNKPTVKAHATCRSQKNSSNTQGVVLRKLFILILLKKISQERVRQSKNVRDANFATSLDALRCRTVVGSKEVGLMCACSHNHVVSLAFLNRIVSFDRSWTPVSTTLGGYVLAHLARKCYSTVKQQLQHQAGYSALFLSEMDASFVAAFAIGTICMIACGKVGGAVDRPSALLTVGLWGSGFCLFLISGAVWFDLVGFNESFGDLFVVAICFIFGLVQAAATTTTGQPTVPPVQSVVGTTGSGSGSGPIGAKTAAAARAGEIMAAVITCLVLDMEWSFEWALLIPAVASMAWAMTTRRSSPRVVDTAEMVLSTVAEAVEDYESDEMLETPDPSDHSSAALAAPITPFTLLTSHDVPAAPGLAQSVVALMQTPRVAQYAVIYGFVQVIHLTLYFWLPYHLGRTFDPSTANMIGTSYSVGMLLMLPSVCVPVVQYTCHHIGGGRASAVAAAFVLLQAIPLGILATYEEAGFPPIAVIILLTCMGMVTEWYVCLYDAYPANKTSVWERRG